MSLKIISPGLLTTIQDTGRHGYQKDGMVVSGAMDAVALRIANILAGNEENEAALEITMMGPKIVFEEDVLLALTGGDLSASIDDAPVKMWRPVLVRKGSTLAFGKPVKGCRAYLAVSGGFDLPKVMGSYATYLRAGVGGFGGRALKAGDLVPCKGPTPKAMQLMAELTDSAIGKTHAQVAFTFDPRLFPAYEENPTIRALKGPEYDQFTENSQNYIWNEKFLVTPQSDRMGYRLLGMTLALKEEAELVSSAVSFGTVQVPVEGNPIVLMADHQTTGGYPRIVQVISADFSKLAQVPPGKSVRFTEVSLDEAHQLYMNQEKSIEQVKRALQIKAWR
ncbi:antagonist of KipI [Pontibacter ummariensis]|uniref:Antagonist of KipI n=1 Tax=Pontibacter ummariensis TaxID=1610492 RepID=A0A239ICG2_9BACT|nr:biotin-dependent carboxyltransferase family protein [Pontibacter ummariensis]PRY09951.1 antagonist of KipI [Pontibacter ummariensis]SNS90743.1 antagonist of KipI [Pontibacter ummariensis]